MKIIHTSDWHIGQNFYRFDREEEHQFFFKQLRELMCKEIPDALVVSGDIFHTSLPSPQSQRFFVETLLSIKQAVPNAAIVITSGNHDSASRLEVHRSLWHTLSINIIGGSRRLINGTFDPTDFIVELPGKGIIIAVPFFHPSNFPAVDEDMAREERQKAFFDCILYKALEYDLPVVMMAHLAVAGCDIEGHEEGMIAGMDKESLDTLGVGYDYLALGHIHKPQSVSERAFYCGSPLPISFSEEYDHYVNIVEIDEHGKLPLVRREHLDLFRKVKTIPKKGGSLEEALDELRALDKDDNSYIRLLIDQEDAVMVDAEERARRAVGDKACRFCEIRIKPRKKNNAERERDEIVEVSDFTELRHIEVACRHYRNKTNADMPKSLLDKMNIAIQSVTMENSL